MPPATLDILPQRNAGPVSYAAFVVRWLIICLFASVGVFAVFEASARNTVSLAIPLGAALITVFAGLGAARAWRSVLSREAGNARHRPRNILVAGTVFVLLYACLAAFLGSVIGQNRAESIEFEMDLHHQRELADRISRARNGAARNIPSYVAMYEAIEADVKEYASVLSKVRAEWDKYDSKFPTQHAATQKYKSSVDKEIRRSALLAKQIAVAKQIGLLEEPYQISYWRSEMVPLLNEEDTLDQSR
jgi:hypothetical protein